jgi:hypothetical protein
MKSVKTAMVVFCLGALGAALAPRAKADEWDNRTVVTFSKPVEIPGMVLPPGKYIFKLLDSETNRNIVQIFNADQSHLYATLLAISDYRLLPRSKTVISFEERAAGSPEAIKAWFYPGENYGQEFVYPKSRAVELAKAVKQPVMAMPSEMSQNISKPAKSATEAHVVAMKKAPVEVVTPPQQIAQVERPNPPVIPEHKRMPKTASDYPLLALAGLLSLGAAAGLRLFEKVSA